MSGKSGKSGKTGETGQTGKLSKPGGSGASEASGQPKSSSRSASPRARTRSAGSRKKAAADDIGPIDAAGDAAAREALKTADKLYYRIGEVSRLTGVKAHVLRYWETEFRWMAPPKSRSKQRLYRKRDIEFVWLLKRLLWGERYTIAGARQRIQELGVEGALALLDGAPGTRAAAGGAADEIDSTETAEHTTSTTDSPRIATAEWVSFRAALGEMQSDLLALKGMLQDGA